jgi:ureidoacrylate peracid hydrolase
MPNLPENFIRVYVSSRNLAAKTRIWLNRIALFNKHEMQLRPDRSCLLVIDMQRYFVDPAGAAYLPSAQAILGNVRRLIEAFRASSRPVIYTRHVHHPERLDLGILGQWWGDMIVDGTPDSEIYPAIAPLAIEKVITKHRYSAFYDTDLQTVLRVLKIEDLAICGVMTNLCCESTAREAFSRDYQTFFLADATGTDNEEMHLASLLNLAYGFAYVTTTHRTIQQIGGFSA